MKKPTMRDMPFKPVDTIGVADEPPDHAEVLEKVLKKHVREVRTDMALDPKNGLVLRVFLEREADMDRCEAAMLAERKKLMPIYREFPNTAVKFLVATGQPFDWE